MDWTCVIVGVCTVVTTVIAVVSILGKKFEKIVDKFEKVFSILNQQSQRLSKIEGYIEGRDVHLKLTGTEKQKE